LQVDLNELKRWLHEDLSRTDKLLAVLGSFDEPKQVRELVARAREAGLKAPEKWNVSAILKGSDGLAIRVPKGWEIGTKGRARLDLLGVGVPQASQPHPVASKLRSHLNAIKDPTTRAFVEEAVGCYEAGFFRSAIVMAWVAATHVLYEWVVLNKLAEFDAAAKAVDPKWKTAKSSDDLTAMKEFTFLERLYDIKAINKSLKQRLQVCLQLRNGCGHPNSLKVGEHEVTAHIEALLLNVFDKFAV
jgi:hypothetical protein